MDGKENLMSNGVSDILKSVVGELREIAKSESVIGQPVTLGDRTVIPVMKLSFGFGAGGGQGTDEKHGSGFGGGGGGGAKIEPAAFIVMEKDSVRLLLTQRGKWESLVDAIPDLADKIQTVAQKFKGDASKSDPAAKS